MIRDKPQWTYASRTPLVQWYGYVRLLPQRVVGQWFCLDRHSGARLWHGRLQRPNEIIGIDDGVIVATCRQRLSFSSARSGCYGISLETGRLLWTSHASGLWRRVLRLLDFVPDYPNILFPDSPVYVADGRCYCRSGRVLDVRTGRSTARLPSSAVQKPQEPESQTGILGRSRNPTDPVRLRVPDGVWLSHKPGLEPTPEGEDGFPRLDLGLQPVPDGQ